MSRGKRQSGLSHSMSVPHRKNGGRREMAFGPTERAAAKENDKHVGSQGLCPRFRWERKLGIGRLRTIGDLASKEGIAPCYVKPGHAHDAVGTENFEPRLIRGTEGPEGGRLERCWNPYPSGMRWAQQHFISSR